MQSKFEEVQRRALNSHIDKIQKRIKSEDVIRADIHIHEYESRIPDEVIGQLMGIGESWVKADDVEKCLRSNGSEFVTITNHNNARVCWELMNRGYDFLSGAEFTCSFRDRKLSVHVLAYGFTPQEEKKMESLRGDILKFLYYCRERNIPTILAHPTYYYGKNLTVEDFNTLYILFDRFEVLNGQRSTWHNNLALNWVESFSHEKIFETERKAGLKMRDFCSLKEKAFTGGSDDHFALYAGGTRTMFDVSKYDKKLNLSEKVLRAIRDGRTAPEGSVGTMGKASMASMVYFFQIVNNMEKISLGNVLSGKGPVVDKIGAVVVSEIIKELQKDKEFMSYSKTFLRAVQGKRVSPLKRIFVPKDYKFILQNMDKLAQLHGGEFSEKEDLHRWYMEGCEEGFHELMNRRIKDHQEKKNEGGKSGAEKSLIKKVKNPLFNKSLFDLALIRGTGSMYSKRSFMERLSEDIGDNGYLRKTLWLTNKENEIRESSDSDTLEILTMLSVYEHESRVKRLHTENDIKISTSPDLKLKIFSYLELQKLFAENDYNHILCSMDINMGLAAMLLIQSFNVKADLFISEDWIKNMEKIDDSSFGTSDVGENIMNVLSYGYELFHNIVFSKESHKTRFQALVNGSHKLSLKVIDSENNL